MRLRNKILVLTLLFIFSLQFCLAQDSQETINSIKQQLKKTKSAEDSEVLLKELLDIYSQDNKFDEFYDFLGTLEQISVFKKDSIISYYKSLTRFKQMQFLEENEMWEQLFTNKDSYSQDLDKSIAKAKKLNTSVNPLVLRLKLLEVQTKGDSEGVSIVELEDLFNLVSEYADTDSDIEVIKDIADTLAKDGEEVYARKLYRVYVSKIPQMDIDQEQLKEIAEDFLAVDRVDLAVSLYDVYLDRISKVEQDKDMALEKMFDVAGKFLHSGWAEGIDPFFAEKLYERIESYSAESFNDSSQHERAYNLERIKEHEPSFSEYLKLVNNFPEYPDRDRIYFRLGILSAYEFNRVDEARGYFLKVVDKFPESIDFLNSLYHLGLLEQWEEDFEKAREFYNRILKSTKELKEKPEITKMAEARLKEIENNRDIEYNLRMFLKAALEEKEEVPYLKLELFGRSAKSYIDKNIRLETSSYFTDTGCLQEDFTYLWSGELGSNQLPFNEFDHETTYNDSGTKVVNVVLIGPTGIVDGTVEMVNIYLEDKE